MEQGAILNVSAPPSLPVRRLRAWLAARQAPLPRRHRAIKGLAKTEKSRDLMRALPRKSSGFFRRNLLHWLAAGLGLALLGGMD